MLAYYKKGIRVGEIKPSHHSPATGWRKACSGIMRTVPAPYQLQRPGEHALHLFWTAQ